MLLDQYDHDVGAYIPDSVADAGDPCYQVYAKAISTSSNNGVMYVDDLIFTTNETSN
jgi:hypothetical protein